MDDTHQQWTYRGSGMDMDEAFRRDRATLAVFGWEPVAAERVDDGLRVTFQHIGPDASSPAGDLRGLWKPFAAGIVLAAVILVVLIPVLAWASR